MNSKLEAIEIMDKEKAKKRKYNKKFRSKISEEQMHLIPNLSPMNNLDYFTFPKTEASYIDENIIYLLIAEDCNRQKLIGMMNCFLDINEEHERIDLLSKVEKLNFSFLETQNNKYIYVTYEGRKLTLHKFIMEQLGYNVLNDIDHVLHTYKDFQDNRESNFVTLSPKLNRRKAICFDKVIAGYKNIKVYPYIDWYSSAPSLYLTISYMKNYGYESIVNGEKVNISYYLEEKRVYLKFNDILPKKIYENANKCYVDMLETVAKNITDTYLLKVELPKRGTPVYFYEQHFNIPLSDCEKEINFKIKRIENLIEEYKDDKHHIFTYEFFVNIIYKVNIPHITDIKIISNDGEILYEAEGKKKVVEGLLNYIEKNMKQL